MFKIKRKPQPWYFLFGTVIWTWILFIMAGYSGQGWLQFPTIILTALGALAVVFLSWSWMKTKLPGPGEKEGEE